MPNSHSFPQRPLLPLLSWALFSRGPNEPHFNSVYSGCSEAGREEGAREHHHLSCSPVRIAHPGSRIFLASAYHSTSSLPTPVLPLRSLALLGTRAGGTPQTEGDTVWPGAGRGGWGQAVTPSAAALPGLTLLQRHGDGLLLEVWCAAAFGDLVHQLPDAHPMKGRLLGGLPWRRWGKAR